MKGMITHVVVGIGDDDKPRGSHTSLDGLQVPGRKDTGAPKKFLEKEHAEVKSRIAETGAEAEGIVERQRERFCVAQRPAEPRELEDTSELRLCCPKVVSHGVSFEQFSGAEYGP
ncbi:hypothetical protein MRX96_025410 [Rhipicephalus microplus]